MSSIEPTPTTMVTLDLVSWRGAGTLELSPKFQRRPVWSPAARSYFIDTLLRGYPVPPVHIRLRLGRGNKPIREVIDGQQRLRTVLDFTSEESFRLSRSLDAEWAGKTFQQLSEDERERLLMYKFFAFQYQGIDDSKVLEIFARINTYSVALSKQELRNGKYFGLFKRTALDVSREYLTFWRQNRIFTETAIARMQEVELVSELMILLLDGLQDKKATIDDFYRNLDDQWGADPVHWVRKRGTRSPTEEHPLRYLNRDQTVTRFGIVMSALSEAAGSGISETIFRRPPLFYTLFAAVAHRLFGIPGLEGIPSPLREISDGVAVDLRGALQELSELVTESSNEDSLPLRDREFYTAASRQTDNIGPRRQRLVTLWDRAKLGDR